MLLCFTGAEGSISLASSSSPINDFYLFSSATTYILFAWPHLLHFLIRYSSHYLPPYLTYLPTIVVVDLCALSSSSTRTYTYTCNIPYLPDLTWPNLSVLPLQQSTGIAYQEVPRCLLEYPYLSLGPWFYSTLSPFHPGPWTTAQKKGPLLNLHLLSLKAEQKKKTRVCALRYLKHGTTFPTKFFFNQKKTFQRRTRSFSSQVTTRPVHSLHSALLSLPVSSALRVPFDTSKYLSAPPIRKSPAGRG